jgi:hypothetical protein
MTKSLTELAKSCAEPVDPDLFLWCQGICHAAASLSMPVENPAAKPLFSDGDKAYAFSDIPINRGMLAVMKELRERGLSEEQRMAISWRIMHFGDIFKHQNKLQAFIKNGDGPGELQVSEALIKACATARIITTKKNVRYDINDVARIAQELTDAEEKGESD